MVFIPGVTQGSEEAGSVQDFILFLYKSGKLGRRRYLRFPFVPSGGKFRVRPSSRYNKKLGSVAFRILSNMLIASAKIPEREGIISPSSIYEQLPIRHTC